MRVPAGALNLPHKHPASGFPGGGARRHVVVRNDIHPALVTLLLETARDVHSGTQLFAPAGSFPNRERLDLPLHDDGARYFSRGPSFLSRYLPFGIAVWVERMIVVPIPLITILLSVMRFAPAAYRWQAQRKVYHWYNQVRQLEAEAASAQPERLGAIRRELDGLQQRLSNLRVSAAYAQQLYQLRMHLDFVRARLKETLIRYRQATPGSHCRRPRSC